MDDARKEILFGLPSQIEIAEALAAIPAGPHHETVRRMASALDLLQAGGWEFVSKAKDRPKRLSSDEKRLHGEP